MKRFSGAIRRFFKDLRRADLKTRKRWRALLSGVSMIFIVTLWVLYSRAAFPSYDATATETAASATQTFAATTSEAVAPTPQSHTGGESVWDTLGRGLAVFGEDLQKGVGAVGSAVRDSFDKAAAHFRKTNTFEVRTPASTQDATTTAPEPIPPTPLPQ